MTRQVPALTRWTNTACTWYRKAVYGLHENAEGANPDVRWLIGYEANRLIEAVLWNADMLVALLNDDDVEAVENALREIAGKARKRRLSASLANTNGRTEQEAAAFRRKASEMEAS